MAPVRRGKSPAMKKRSNFKLSSNANDHHYDVSSAKIDKNTTLRPRVKKNSKDKKKKPPLLTGILTLNAAAGVFPLLLMLYSLVQEVRSPSASLHFATPDTEIATTAVNVFLGCLFLFVSSRNFSFLRRMPSLRRSSPRWSMRKLVSDCLPLTLRVISVVFFTFSILPALEKADEEKGKTLLLTFVAFYTVCGFWIERVYCKKYLKDGGKIIFLGEEIELGSTLNAYVHCGLTMGLMYVALIYECLFTFTTNGSFFNGYEAKSILHLSHAELSSQTYFHCVRIGCPLICAKMLSDFIVHPIDTTRSTAEILMILHHVCTLLLCYMHALLLKGVAASSIYGGAAECGSGCFNAWLIYQGFCKEKIHGRRSSLKLRRFFRLFYLLGMALSHVVMTFSVFSEMGMSGCVSRGTVLGFAILNGCLVAGRHLGMGMELESWYWEEVGR